MPAIASVPSACAAQVAPARTHRRNKPQYVMRKWPCNMQYCAMLALRAVTVSALGRSDDVRGSAGRENYGKAVATLFSPDTARADLIACNIRDDHTIELTWRCVRSVCPQRFQ